MLVSSSSEHTVYATAAPGGKLLSCRSASAVCYANKPPSYQLSVSAHGLLVWNIYVYFYTRILVIVFSSSYSNYDHNSSTISVEFE